MYAKHSQFGRRVAHGMLGLAYAHGLMWPRTGELRETVAPVVTDPTVRISCTPNCSSNYVLTMPKGTMEDLSHNLAGAGDRPVVDQTGLAGTFDIKLTYKPAYVRSSSPELDLNDISIFTAVQDQLGLKLEPTKATIQMLVVDHVEKPSEN